MAFGWLPFYCWVVFGLGLGGESWGLTALNRGDSRSALALATTVALATTYIHRHYTLLLVYGDRTTFAARSTHYLLTPVLFALVIGAARWGKHSTFAELGPLRVSPWGLIVTIGTVWNIWHSVQQRYGILRAYGGRCQAGLHTPKHARRDFWLLWSLIGAVIVLVLGFQRHTFSQHRNTRFLEQKLGPLLDAPGFTAVLYGVCALCGLATIIWLKHELKAKLQLQQRLPRWTFLFSTFVLLGIFVWHGPLVGYLCFGVAHALEYLAFVHHFGEKKYAKGDGSEAKPGLASRLFSKPLLSAPLLILSFIALYALVRGYKGTDLYVVYYITTSFLHFLYDGWIWKVRKPSVAAPLGINRRAPT